MADRTARWFPRTLGGVTLLMAAAAYVDWALIPPDSIGPPALWGSLPNIVLLWGASWGCFRRWRIMPVVVIGYTGGLIAAVWWWTVVYESERVASLRGPILVNLLVTAMLLAFCRVTWQRRVAFTR